MPTAEPTTGSPPIVGRCLSIAEWLAYVDAYDFGPIAPDLLVVHHTWKPTESEWTGRRSIEALQRYYRGKGWSAGPHFFAAPDGIWLFTPMSSIGVHANAGNSWHDADGRLHYSLGLEMVGDFDQHRPTGLVWANAKAVIGGLSRRLGIRPAQLLQLHRRYNPSKTCPGLSVDLAWLVAEADAWLNAQQATDLVAWHAAHGGVPVLGMVLGAPFTRADAQGETCRWLRCENGIIKEKPSQAGIWRIRLAQLAELQQLGMV